MKRAIGKQLTNWVTCIAKAILIFCIASVASLVASYFWATTIVSFLLKAFYRPISSPEIASLGAKLGANNLLVNVKIAALMAILLVAPIALSYFLKIFRGGGLSRLSACLIGVSSTAIGALIGYTQLLARIQYFGAHAPLAPELANEVLSMIISEMIVYGVVAFSAAGLLFNFRQRVTP